MYPSGHLDLYINISLFFCSFRSRAALFSQTMSLTIRLGPSLPRALSNPIEAGQAYLCLSLKSDHFSSLLPGFAGHHQLSPGHLQWCPKLSACCLLSLFHVFNPESVFKTIHLITLLPAYNSSKAAHGLPDEVQVPEWATGGPCDLCVYLWPPFTLYHSLLCALLTGH